MRQLSGIVRHRATALLLAAVLAASCSAAAAPTSGAQAYPLPRYGPVVEHTKTYTATWTFRDGSLRRCVTYTVTGGIKYDTQVQEPSGVIEWTKQRLSPQPTLAASVRAYDSGRCGGTAKLAEMSMGQHWSGYSCSFNPSRSFAAFWAIVVSFWPGCGNKSQADLTTVYGSSSSYTQYTNGVPPPTFGDYGGLPDQEPCYGLYVSSQIYVSAHAPNMHLSSPAKLCLPS